MEYNNQAVDRIVDASDKGVEDIPYTDGGILARLFRKFLLFGNVNRMRWREYMDAYVRAVESGQAGVRPNLVSIKGNATKFLAKDEFTWKNFVKAMRFLQTKKLRIIIERTDFTGRVYTVEEIVEFNTPVQQFTEESDTKNE